MAERLPRWIVRRGGVYYYKRHVPERYRHLTGSPVVVRSLETGDLGKAVVYRDKLNELTEAHWQSLVRGDAPDARERYQAAIERARLEGFSYLPFDKLRETSIDSLLDRIALLEATIGFGTKQKLQPDGLQMRSALLGFEDEPGLRFSTLIETFEKMTGDERLGRNELQLRKWRNPLLRAVANVMKVVGDKPLAEFSRADALAFRDWWAERLRSENLSPDSANKDISSLSKMIALVSDRLELDLPRKFRGLRFEPGQVKRPPFSPDHIRNVILAPGALSGLNDDARGIILTMIETGARPSELAHLLPGTINLEGAIPFISIEPSEGFAMKTPFSKRQLPLVGVAIDGARVLREGSQRYRSNTDTLSGTVGKYLAENKLLETEDHSVYSFRHSFKDRLTEVSAPDIIDASLMGHKFDRPDYGKGPSLALKLEWIRKIAISV